MNPGKKKKSQRKKITGKNKKLDNVSTVSASLFNSNVNYQILSSQQYLDLVKTCCWQPHSKKSLFKLKEHLPNFNKRTTRLAEFVHGIS